MCMKKVESKITFKTKTGYYFELLIVETTKLLKDAGEKITKDKTNENIPKLEIIEILVYYSLANNNYQQNS